MRTAMGTPTATPTVTDLFDLENCPCEDAGVNDGRRERVDEPAEEAEAGAGEDIDGERVDELRVDELREDGLEVLDELDVDALALIPTVTNGNAFPGKMMVCVELLQLQSPQQYLLSSHSVRDSKPASEATD
jgi:hypothetical protein